MWWLTVLSSSAECWLSARVLRKSFHVMEGLVWKEGLLSQHSPSVCQSTHTDPQQPQVTPGRVWWSVRDCHSWSWTWTGSAFSCFLKHLGLTHNICILPCFCFFFYLWTWHEKILCVGAFLIKISMVFCGGKWNIPLSDSFKIKDALSSLAGVQQKAKTGACSFLLQIPSAAVQSPGLFSFSEYDFCWHSLKLQSSSWKMPLGGALCSHSCTPGLGEISTAAPPHCLETLFFFNFAKKSPIFP